MMGALFSLHDSSESPNEGERCRRKGRGGRDFSCLTDMAVPGRLTGPEDAMDSEEEQLRRAGTAPGDGRGGRARLTYKFALAGYSKGVVGRLWKASRQ